MNVKRHFRDVMKNLIWAFHQCWKSNIGQLNVLDIIIELVTEIHPIVFEIGGDNSQSCQSFFWISFIQICWPVWGISRYWQDLVLQLLGNVLHCVQHHVHSIRTHLLHIDLGNAFDHAMIVLVYAVDNSCVVLWCIIVCRVLKPMTLWLLTHREAARCGCPSGTQVAPQVTSQPCILRLNCS